MLDSLRALHDQIGRAIRSLEPLAGVIKAWEAAQDVQRRAAAVAEPPVSALGAATPGEAPAASAASFGAEAPESPAQQTCPGCGGPFTPKNGRQRFCTRPCGQRFWMTQRKAARKAPGRARRRRGTRVPPETGSPADERPAWSGRPHGTAWRRPQPARTWGRCRTILSAISACRSRMIPSARPTSTRRRCPGNARAPPARIEQHGTLVTVSLMKGIRICLVLVQCRQRKKISSRTC